MTMRHLKWKLLFAGGLLACVFGGIGIGVALATPGAGVTNTPLAGPVALDEINIAAQSPTHGIILQTRGDWECRVIQHTIVPGGHTGWHSHPGPVFVMITAGTMTIYHADDPTTPIHYPAGTGFVDHGGAHIAGNAGDVDLKIVGFYLIPKGSNPRIDEPAP
jgi:hypothetical protein